MDVHVLIDQNAGGTLRPAAMVTETTITNNGASGNSEAEGQGVHLLVMSPESLFSQPLPDAGYIEIGRSSRCQAHIEDPLASREHARIAVSQIDGVSLLTVEDRHSANGTWVRDALIPAGQPIPIHIGEAVRIGATVVMVMQDRNAITPRRVWSHAHLEGRVDDECVRSAKSRAPFALARIRFSGDGPWPKALPIFARELSQPHVFAMYGPNDFEALLIDTSADEAERMVQRLVLCCRDAGLVAHSAVAFYPVDGRSADALLATANAKLKGQSARPAAIPMEQAGIRRVRSMAARVAMSSINVLVMGETGVGKDVLVHAIHRASRRADKPLVVVNCAALPETLIESELFGHDRGAFTGATTSKIGLLESANGGAVFLDEVGELAQAVQAKLLRAIESHEVTPLGGVRPHAIDVRFISATNRDIEGDVAAGRFRGDLMFRLNGISLLVPPLRERTDEIPGLIEAFIAEACSEIERKSRPRFSAAAMAYIMSYAWPGNIRELKNVVERAVVLSDGVTLGPEHLPIEKMHTVLPSGERPTPVATRSLGGQTVDEEDGSSLDAKHLADKRRIEEMLAACNGNQTRAARQLGISRRTLITKMEKYNLPRPQKAPRETPPSDL